MGKVIGIVLLLLAALLLAALNFFFNFAHRRRRPKRQKKPAPPANEAERRFQDMVAEGRAWVEGHPGERVSVTSFDGLRLQGLYFPADRPRACVLLFHGYRSTGLRDFGLLIPYYHDSGFSVLAVDQRACGESEGTYITFGVKERQDVLAWARYMDGRLGGQVPLVLEGLSLGAATVMMAADLPLPASVRGIIADCGFTSPWDIIAHCARLWYRLPAFPLVHLLSAYTRLRAGFGYRDCSTLDTLARSSLPVLFIHGGEDRFVPTYMTEQNYEAAAGWKRKRVVPGAGHAMSYPTDQAGCQKALLEFMDHILGEA